MPAKRSQVPGDVVVYAIGDIHGRADLLAQLHQALVRDARERAAKRRVLVYLGDYISRTSQGRGVIDMLLKNTPPGFEPVRLMGNHEDLVLRFLDGDLGAGALWLEQGGNVMLEEYGIEPGTGGADQALRLESLREQLRAALPREHEVFLRSLRICHQEGDYRFVHAGVRPGVALDQQSTRDMLTIRAPFLDSADDFDQVIVHGHSIAAEPQVRPNRIGIDTGAFRTGVLTCLVLQGSQRQFLQTAAPSRDAKSCALPDRGESA